MRQAAKYFYCTDHTLNVETSLICLTSINTWWMQDIKMEEGKNRLSCLAPGCILHDFYSEDTQKLSKFHTTGLASNHAKSFAKECYKNTTTTWGTKVWSQIKGIACIFLGCAQSRNFIESWWKLLGKCLHLGAQKCHFPHFLWAIS